MIPITATPTVTVSGMITIHGVAIGYCREVFFTSSGSCALKPKVYHKQWIHIYLFCACAALE